MAFHKCFHNLQKKTEAHPLQVSLSPPPRKITIVIITGNQAPVYQQSKLLSEAALHTGKVQLSQGAFHLKHSLAWTSRVEGVVVVLFWFLIIQASLRLPYRHRCFTGSAPGWQGLPSSWRTIKQNITTTATTFHLWSIALELPRSPKGWSLTSSHPSWCCTRLTQLFLSDAFPGSCWRVTILFFCLHLIANQLNVEAHEGFTPPAAAWSLLAAVNQFLYLRLRLRTRCHRN